MNSSQIRESFISFFKSKAHTFVHSSPVVPQNDPTIMFTNAGMNQFKDVFLGQGTRPYSRAVNSQICIRVSGKHNDLEDVGLDTTHHTLFEMLGNWSFGDYYKTEAISWAWELLTNEFNLPKNKLYATVYKTDAESAELWKTLTDINADHVLPFGDKENFWEMGEVGPCGPCSELHLDRGEACCDKQGIPHTCAVNGDCARYIELWNLVFIQYNRESDGKLTELPHKHVDTGAGLERITAYLQNTTSNYETDLFLPIIQTIETLSGIPYTNTPEGMPHRVMADHIRTLTFSIADNVMPSNEGRGYVIRRILRRALRYAAKLGFKTPILHQLVKSVVQVMGQHFDHIAKRQAFIEQVILAEEESFLRTLDLGLHLFETIAAQSTHHQVSGQDAFKLYDTFGFPLDLTQVLARERQLTVDVAGFNIHMEAQRQRSRSAVKLQEATFKDGPMGGEARLVTDPEEKIGMARHHTSTHLLHAALRQVLGTHVHQAGSLVDVDHLRFDFTHFQALTPEQLATVERIVNQKVKEAIPVSAFEKPIAEAKAMGAMALFGEKYDDMVRVIQIGEFSMELCGGHHVPVTSTIEQIKLIHESAVAAGTRRIEAIAGEQNINHYAQLQREKWKAKLLPRVNALLASHHEPAQFPDWDTLPLASFPEWDARLLDLTKQNERNLLAQKQQAASSALQPLLDAKQPLSPTLTWIHASLPDYDRTMLLTLADELVNIEPTAVVTLASPTTAQLVVKCGPNTTCLAPNVLTAITAITGGKGGGKPTFAQAGGLDSTQLEPAFAACEAYLKTL